MPAGASSSRRPPVNGDYKILCEEASFHRQLEKAISALNQVEQILKEALEGGGDSEEGVGEAPAGEAEERDAEEKPSEEKTPM